MYTLFVYDRAAVLELLRTTSPRQLRQQLPAIVKDAAPRAAFDEILSAWEWRALGVLPLRDALCVDAQRGQRFYGQLCAALALEQVTLEQAELAALGLDASEVLDRQRRGAILASEWPLLAAATFQPVNLSTLAPPLASEWPALAGLLQREPSQNLALGLVRAGEPPDLALPPELLGLLPPRPQAMPVAAFEVPSGLRRVLATALVAFGVVWLGVQLLLWESSPIRPAGGPLALFTLALLVGVRAGWPGYLGSACIWLVANLPGFHYRTVFSAWSISLLAAGLLLIACDRRLRAMWAWVMRRLMRH